jgi:catechol 2,3-dioxygenase-like lactoylglutathione lyase family enzyme
MTGRGQPAGETSTLGPRTTQDADGHAQIVVAASWVTGRSQTVSGSGEDTTMTSDAETHTSNRPRIGFDIVALDTDDPPRLAEFYTALLGWQVESTEDDWITLRGDGDARIALQLALNHKPPTWPDNEVPQQLHLDFEVDDLDAASAYAVSIGARPIEGPVNSSSFRVFLDPSGHPFCLCR